MGFQDEYPLHAAINQVVEYRRLWLKDNGVDVSSWIVDRGLTELLDYLKFNRGYISKVELKAKWQELDKMAADEVEALLTATPNIIDVPNEIGTTALRLAVEMGNTAAVRVLLQHKADERAAKEYGVTILHFAVQNNDEEMVALLLDEGIELTGKEEYGSMTLHMAVRSGSMKMVEWLLQDKRADINATEEGGSTALHVAVSSGNLEMAKLLLGKGADVAAKDDDGRTALLDAACYKNTEIVRLLLELKASITAVNKTGRTVLHFAACYSNTKMVELLWSEAVEKNAVEKVDAMDERGNNPLGHMIAALQHDIDDESVAVAHYLCSKGSQPKLQVSALKEHQLGLIAIAQYWHRCYGAGKPLMRIPLEAVRSGESGVESYLVASENTAAGGFVYRSKICVVGPSTWGKTTLVKSVRDEVASAVDKGDHTIGIDLFSMRFEGGISAEPGDDEDSTSDDKRTPIRNLHDVTFWDFAGQDIYQVTHALYFSKRTLYLLCINLEAYVEKIRAKGQLSSVIGNRLMQRFFEENVLRWMRLVLLRQPDAQFKVVGTHFDRVEGAPELLKATLDVQERLISFLDNNDRQVEILPEAVDAMRTEFNKPLLTTGISENSGGSLKIARKNIEDTIIDAANQLSFKMPAAFNRVLECIVQKRRLVASKAREDRFGSVIVPVEDLCTNIRAELTELTELTSDVCRGILRTLHNLGEVVWYENKEGEVWQKSGANGFGEYIILDPTIMLDIVSEVVNHVYEGKEGGDYDALRKDGTLRHSLLMTFPSWSALNEVSEDMVPLFKRLLVQLKLVYPANNAEGLDKDDMIVPAYWNTKKVAQGISKSLARTASVLDTNGESILGDSGTHVAQWQYSLPVSISETDFVNFVVQCYRSYVRRDVGKTFLDCFAPGEFVGSIKFTPHTMNPFDDITITVAASTNKVAWAEMQYLVVAMELVLKDYRGLESPEERRIKRSVVDSKGVHGVTKLMNNPLQEEHVRKDFPWLPPDFSWFLQCAWENPGQLDHLQLNRDLAMLKSLIINDNKRQFPAVWTLLHNKDKKKVELRMHSELTGLCYHDPLLIDAPSFFRQIRRLIKVGIMVLSIASAAIPSPIAGAAVNSLLSESLNAVDRAKALQDVLGNSPLNCDKDTKSSLDQKARMGKLRDILLLHSPPYGEFTVGAASNLCCATTNEGDYVWVHSSELGRLEGRYTARTPITFYITDVGNLSKRDFLNVFCEWKIMDGSGAIRNGKTDPAMDLKARALWIRSASELDHVDSISKLRECTLEIVVKRLRRYTGCFRSHKEIARIKINLCDYIGKDCNNYETIKINLEDTPTQPFVTCNFAIPQSKQDKTSQDPIALGA
ncbi:hypothetical protein PF004_g9702 [Phytophthora fragariae]|uniref:Uncharacterized protein n=2 Tax=Phytophthora fragariae TaxID=53985 RepID=A0A6A3KPU0_9STRA|nr:hypothetical protein PF011_g11021 [Phytophthora fragariae]KAE9233279.1 hypothetical protein PF004_g9702 [Phytophthora fragariae]